ncbi:hypothetical protein [Sphingomonas colocasiae]|uniref:hypothetical protein n=1 Tax=Sphingomonas colocasiae TaxID=1848973 RepID=UPI001CA767F8|nr:hypothetical protein [Sphingomonas colocasiae]
MLIGLPSQASASCDGGWPKCWEPEIRIGSGGGGGGPKKGAKSASSTVLEPDPVYQAPGCHAPYRARNLTNRRINVIVLERWKQSGPGCNITGEETPRHLILDPRESEFLGCSTQISSMGSCTDIRKWRIPEQKKKKIPKKKWSRPDDNGPRH